MSAGNRSPAAGTRSSDRRVLDSGRHGSREVREPLSLLEEVESVLSIDCAPISWPIGMGKRFGGVFHLPNERLLRFAPGEERVASDTEEIVGLDNPRLDALFPEETVALRHDVELIRAASHPFDLDSFLAGQQTPVFFGSAINNFGVQEVLRALVDWAPPPQPRDATTRDVAPTERSFSGFVFKIQANMDPRHRDRIAFFRVCSGRYVPAMKVRHLRLGREIKLANALTFRRKVDGERSRQKTPGTALTFSMVRLEPLQPRFEAMLP